MSYPKVTFIENDRDQLANYLCYLAFGIYHGFYQQRRFLVLPKLVAQDPRTVYFPSLKYPRDFWAELEKIDPKNNLFFFPKSLRNKAANLLLNQPQMKSHLPTLWCLKERLFFKEFEKVLTNYKLRKINKIQVFVTPFGTSDSFTYKKVNNKYDFYLTVRSDFGPAQIAEGIITLFMQIEQPTNKLPLWYQTESNVDFLLSNTTLGKVFDCNYQPTVSKHPDVLPENLVVESQIYLSRLGFPLKPILQNIQDISLTPTEKIIMEILAKNKNKLVTHDSIGFALWGDDELAADKFSLYSISKAVEQIRKKVKDMGIYQELIHTIRGKGYVLYD